MAVLRNTGYYVICDRGSERSRMQIFSPMGHFIRRIPIRFIDIVAGLAISREGQLFYLQVVPKSSGFFFFLFFALFFRSFFNFFLTARLKSRQIFHSKIITFPSEIKNSSPAQILKTKCYYFIRNVKFVQSHIFYTLYYNF